MNPALEEARSALGERLRFFLEALQPAQREDVVRALEEEGKLFHQPAALLDGRWALLSFFLARALRAEVDEAAASAVALAVECVICSTDLLDDAMDEDATLLIQQLGVPRVLNVALALLCLAQRLLLVPALPAQLQTRLLDTVQEKLLLAAAGQQQDLLAESRLVCELSQEECLAIASAKAGTLLGLACQLGAICAGVEETRIAQCAEMGRLLGIAAQLDNDAHDLSLLLSPPTRGEMALVQKSDLVRAKKTLPVVLAASSLRATQVWDERRVDAALRNLAALSDEEQAASLAALHEGILATWGIALLYRERARDSLREIERGGPLSPVLRLVLGLGEELAAEKQLD